MRRSQSSDLTSKVVEKETEIQRLVEENISERVFDRLQLLTISISENIELHTELTERIRNYRKDKGSWWNIHNKY